MPPTFCHRRGLKRRPSRGLQRPFWRLCLAMSRSMTSCTGRARLPMAPHAKCVLSLVRDAYVHQPSAASEIDMKTSLTLSNLADAHFTYKRLWQDSSRGLACKLALLLSTTSMRTEVYCAESKRGFQGYAPRQGLLACLQAASWRSGD